MSFETDVPGIFADEEMQWGIESFPVFNVTPEVFNQKTDFEGDNYRKKLIPDEGTSLENYLNNTETSRPFYLKTDGPDGDPIFKKIR